MERKIRLSGILYVALIVLSSCATDDSADVESDPGINANPAADGFNAAGSDPEAMALADSVMEAMGGRKNWDATRTIAWNFFGFRTLIWDKWTGDVRIDSDRDTTTYLLNINSMEGKVKVGDREITDPEELEKLLTQGRSIWINDSYWLIMPYKLKDTGVTLNYLGTDTTHTGDSAHKLQLTFDNVGDTPENKYHVWVDDDHLVRQWAYFQYDTLSEPRFITPWDQYRQHGDILLSGDRGQRQLTDIKVLGEVPASVFDSFEPVDPGTL